MDDIVEANNSDSNSSELSAFDKLRERQKKELKELQASIRQAKKQVLVNDKKRKKQVNEESSKKEDELKARHKNEFEELLAKQKLDSPQETKVEVQSEPLISEKTAQKPSRAQRRREKKQNEKKARMKELEELENSEQITPRAQENKVLEEMLKLRNLHIFDIPADGNCLFAAVADQMRRRGNVYSVEELRELATSHMAERAEDFMPYMLNDSGDLMSQSEFDSYLKNMEIKPSWGGQEEIKALAVTLKSPIEIVQADRPSLIFGDQFDDNRRIILSYHQHMYRLGQHYNSVVPQNEDSKNEDIFFGK